MTYNLKFLPAALKEWEKLDPSIQQQFTKRLAERLNNPHILSAKLVGFDTVYKIKLRTAGYRLAYEVIEHRWSSLYSPLGNAIKTLSTKP